jgi:hypothetical protein
MCTHTSTISLIQCLSTHAPPHSCTHRHTRTLAYTPLTHPDPNRGRPQAAHSMQRFLLSLAEPATPPTAHGAVEPPGLLRGLSVVSAHSKAAGRSKDGVQRPHLTDKKKKAQRSSDSSKVTQHCSGRTRKFSVSLPPVQGLCLYQEPLLWNWLLANVANESVSESWRSE